MKVRLRAIRESDSFFLFEVFYFARVDEFQAAGWEPGVLRDFLAHQFRLQHSYYQMAFPQASFQFIEVDGARAGRLYVDRTDRTIHILDLALLPSYRGQGLGGALLGALAAEADATERALRLEVEPHNPARSLYQRMGFRDGEQHDFYLTMERPPAPIHGGAHG